ncbi:MAG: Gfo/Idh/MocA family oxidoreductase [Pirellulaceae bacterium]|nr:Gfo/Idh/MocA family oxidoreductase [Pirellulaceae bacterium]
MTPVRIAVIGGGHLGTIHTRLLAASPLATLVAVADPDAATRQRLARDFQVPAVADYRELLDQVEAAVVAAPTQLHHSIVLDLLRHGIHVLVEKPIATSVAQADQMVAEAASRRRVLQVGHVERFNPVLAAATPHLAAPCYIESVRNGPYTFRSTDIGVVLDLMIHDLDLVLALVDSTLIDVAAIGAAVFGPHEDLAQARLQFANGCVVNLTASRVSPEVERRMHVYWRQGAARLDFAGGSARLVRPRHDILSRQFNVHQLPLEAQTQVKQKLFDDYLVLEDLPVPPANAIQREHEDFLEAIRHGSQVRVTGRAGREALAVAHRVLNSIARHRWSESYGLPKAA